MTVYLSTHAATLHCKTPNTVSNFLLMILERLSVLQLQLQSVQAILIV